MQFDDDFGVAFSPLMQPYSLPLNQPESQPTSLFGGTIPAVHFAPVAPIHFGVLPALHGPRFKPVYQSGVVHAHTHFSTIHADLGSHFDVSG
jgi:hypothetical protein